MAGQANSSLQYKTMIKKFVTLATLVAKIEPSRGEPSRAEFENDLDLDLLRSPQLLRNFLDSFALMCATSAEGSKTASAACLEESEPHSPIIRVARNHGLSPEDLSGLQGILEELRIAATGGKSSDQSENDVLSLVAALDKDRIMVLVDKAAKRGLEISRIGVVLDHAVSFGLDTAAFDPDFKSWVARSPFLPAHRPEPGTDGTKTYVMWARHARWTYSSQLRRLLGYSRAQEPPWLEDIHKIARYFSSIKSMVKFAIKRPQLFDGIQVLTIEAQKPCLFSKPSRPRPNLLERTISNLKISRRNWVEIRRDLAQRWEISEDKVESAFEKALPALLTVHAEMQLLNFYSDNPSIVPAQRFIGTSKKACFFCDKYMKQNHLRLKASACHEKIYPTWMPPKCCIDTGVWRFLEYLEGITRATLKSSLTEPPRPRARDSTAGPSLTATATVPTGTGLQGSGNLFTPY